MIIDYKKNSLHARDYQVFDSVFCDQPDRPPGEKIFYADDEAGYYLIYIRDNKGLPYLWDKRTRERISGRDHGVPDEFIELAWDRVDRAITIRLRTDGPPVRFRQFL